MKSKDYQSRKWISCWTKNIVRNKILSVFHIIKVSYMYIGFQKSIKLTNTVWIALPDTWAPDSSLPAYTLLQWRVCYHGDVWAATLIKASRVYIYLENSGDIFLGMILQAPSSLLEDHIEEQWNISQSCPSLSQPVPEGRLGSRSHLETSNRGHKEPLDHGERQAAAVSYSINKYWQD